MKFEKIIIINDPCYEVYFPVLQLLFNFMKTHNNENKLSLDYFCFRTRDSVHSINAKEMILEWIVREKTLEERSCEKEII
jgi:hypothetical protein